VNISEKRPHRNVDGAEGRVLPVENRTTAYWISALLALLVLCGIAQSGHAALPTTAGWYALPNSALRPLCPPDNYGGTTYTFTALCPGIVTAWNSAVMDTKRNRLVVWGGGHNNYAGNEFYAVNLNDQTVQRLNNPSIPTNAGGSCAVTTLPDGSANSRHTYDGIAYMANIDKMFVFGGAPTCAAGGLSRDTWAFDFATMTWQQRNPTGTIPNGTAGIVSAYDPNTGKVFLHDDWNLYTYDYTTDSYTRLAVDNIDYHLTAVIDPVRKKFVMIGANQAWIYDIGAGSTYTRQALVTTGGDAIISSGYPGLAYDPNTDRIVAWNGGDTVYSLNLDTKVWTPMTFAGGPGAAQMFGTFKRWSYSPASGVYVLVNSMDQNVYTLRLGATSITTDTTPDAFAFAAQSGVPLSATVTSAPATITGINAAAPITVSGGSYSINGGGFTTAAGTVTNGNTVAVQLTSAGTSGAQSCANVTIGGVSAQFCATTLSGTPDTTPDAFSFSPQTGVATGATVTSNVVTVSGINAPAPISVTGGSYSVNGGGYTTAGGTVSNGAAVTVRVSAPSTAGAQACATLAIGGVSAQFCVTTQSSSGAGGGTSIGGTTGVTLSSPVTQTLAPFTIGLAFKKGDIAGTPALNIPDQQVVVMRRWNDGSVKHAIASGHVSLTANTPKTITASSGAAATGTPLTAASIQNANPQASISFGGAGSVSLSSLLATPFRTFVSGPEMVEAHYRAQVGSDSTLVAWFHVRMYKNGRIWVRAIGDNGYLDVTTPDKSYVPTVTIGGTQVWNNGGAAISHYAHTRWVQDGWIGGDPQITAQHDTAYLKSTRLVPSYLNAGADAATLSSLYQNYTPNQNGNWTPTMGDTGYQPQIGLLPALDALYITSGGDARAWRSVLANARR